mmetsp:Transcript_3771/g.10832  ORF Transcript_3771/g.10832 Transcript_3771/m.10832 type:complete len:231 (+) Transcript_3771:3051-3743(+)
MHCLRLPSTLSRSAALAALSSSSSWLRFMMYELLENIPPNAALWLARTFLAFPLALASSGAMLLSLGLSLSASPKASAASSNLLIANSALPALYMALTLLPSMESAALASSRAASYLFSASAQAARFRWQTSSTASIRPRRSLKSALPSASTDFAASIMTRTSRYFAEASSTRPSPYNLDPSSLSPRALSSCFDARSRNSARLTWTCRTDDDDDDDDDGDVMRTMNLHTC